ncbi:TIGR03086 family metal-binding protein [Pseudonocardia sp. H11422]|uniref:TIGR03086 family metal-binding protein n=1 Tax=Pseudonocardia sp. H11422 TaxID=2835866 RepID=UPI001BDDAE06|nr:TIGR03086 family metal-binding protein [Pseudonocardia sp. H11422]
MNITELYRRSSAAFGERVHAVDGRWDAATPCPGWNARDLVNHLVNEERWTPPLFGGATIEEVGDRFDSDLLGADPVGTWEEAAAAALAAMEADGAMDRTVHLSFGDHPAAEYATQLAADHLVHAWDLARAVGADETLDPGAVKYLLGWFESMEPIYRSMGAIGERAPMPADADQQARLLAMFGRRS